MKSKMKTMPVEVSGGNFDNDADDIQPHDVHGAMTDIARAEMHKSNPKLMAKVKDVAGKVHAAAGGKIRNMKDLKAARDSFGKKTDEENG